ncbi:Pre-mRNA-splicing factor ATP-dependent RNA helicase dhx15 [Rhizoclosmatium hyalinum]|nr:Pre-mRNA-splicing factor ATP-dependent RNA helicase dhx15 [Rhizoclosmatium hyalinum]
MDSSVVQQDVDVPDIVQEKLMEAVELVSSGQRSSEAFQAIQTLLSSLGYAEFLNAVVGSPDEDEVMVILRKDRQYKSAVNHALADVQAAFDFLHICGYDTQFSRLHDILNQRYSKRGSLKSFWGELKSLQASQIASWRKGNWDLNNRARRHNESEINSENHDDPFSDNDPARRIVLPLRDSNLLFGVCDDRGILKPGQCYVNVVLPNGMTRTLKGRVAVMRNPCYHPGDIVLLEAVDLEQFHHIHNTLVFNTTGDRPDADKCSGGDLDGDRFLVIWDSEVVADLKPCPAFNYLPEELTKCIFDTIRKLGVIPKQPINRAGNGKRRHNEGDDGNDGVSTSEMIDYLVFHEAKDTMVARINALLLDFQKFEYRESDKSILTREELINLLTALFSASVDSMSGIDVETMIRAVQREIAKNRTSELSPFRKLHDDCIKNTDATAQFTKLYERKSGVLFPLFEASVMEDPGWSHPNFVEDFVPNPKGSYAKLTERLLNVGKRIRKQEVSSLLTAEMMGVLQAHLDDNAFIECVKVITALENSINRALDEFQAQELIEISISENVSLFEKCHQQQIEFEKLFNRHASFGRVMRSVCDLVESRRQSGTGDMAVHMSVSKILSNEIDMLKSELPIYSSRNELMDCIESNRVVLITSATGSGKSTCTPNFVANELFFQGNLSPSKQIIVAQPRRNATTSLAQRLAQSRKSALGAEVGSHIGRSRARVNTDRTFLRCVTYGILLLYAQKDPELRDYSVIILDEVHESSSDLYFLFAILKKALMTNKELKVILMSATPDMDKIITFFDECEVVSVEGRTYEVEEFFEGQLSLNPAIYVEAAIAKCIEVHEHFPLNENPDILIFLPTKKDIDEAVHRLRVETPMKNLHVFPLHSKMSEVKKRFILNRSPIHEWDTLLKSDRDYDYPELGLVPEAVENLDFVEWQLDQGGLRNQLDVKIPDVKNDTQRRAIFCTNIAETSLTIPAIGYVIDTGLQFTVEVSPIMKITDCKLQPTTRASAQQRKGRAGRLGPGKCFRLYSADTAEDFANQMYTSPKDFDIHLLRIVDIFGDLLTYPWFKAPRDSEIGWCWSILNESNFAEHDDKECKQIILPDGSLAMELCRWEVSSDMALFLIRIWRSPLATERIRLQCATIAAFLSFGTASIFKPKFRYALFVGMGEVEEFPTIGDYPLPSSFCKANIFIAWLKREPEDRRVFCEKMGLFSYGMESINEIRNNILKTMENRQDVLAQGCTASRVEMDEEAVEMDAFSRQNFILGHLAAGCFTKLGLVINNGDQIAFVNNDDRSVAKIDRSESNIFHPVWSCKLVLFHSIRRQANCPWERFIVSHIDPLPWEWPRDIPSSFLQRYISHFPEIPD